MNNYLIEFRFQGYAKKYLKRTIFEVGKKFRVKGVTGKHVVPHITLFGPFSTRDEKKLVETFHRILKKHNLYHFNLKGFSNFEKRVIFIDILPSKELKELRRELAEELISLRSFLFFKTVKTKPFDYKEDFSFHATIPSRILRINLIEYWAT
jgi:2'-5' RNA ligase